MTLLGAYIGSPDNSSADGQAAATAQWNSLVSALGQTPTMMDTYVDVSVPESEWASNAQWAADSWAATPWARDLTPVIGLPMTADGENALQSFNNIANGSEDAVFNGIFQAWAGDGYHTLDIRPGWEMNGDWEPWAVTSGNASAFVAAFQHIATLAHNFSGATINVVWNPNVGGTPIPVEDYYPGDNSVDIVGLDTYGAPVDSGDPPGSTTDDPNTFTLRNALDFAKQHGKPFAVPETGGTDANFPTQLGNVLAQSGDQVAFVNLWDIDDESGDLSWSSPSDNLSSTAAAWKQAMATIQQAPQSSGSAGGGTANSNDLTMAVPAKETLVTGATIAVHGVTVTDPWAATATGVMKLNVYDKAGTITIAGHTYGPGGGKAAGGMLTGTEAQINADLATLSYKAGAKAGSDTLTVDVINQAGVEVTKTVAITVTAPAAVTPPVVTPPVVTPPVVTTQLPQDLAVAVPASEKLLTHGSVAVKGVAITDPWAANTGGTMALNVYDKTGTITIAGHTYGPGGGKVAGGMLVGTEAQLNADLATLTYKAGAKAGSDTLSIDVWNQAGVEVTRTVAITVAARSQPTAPAAAPSTPALSPQDLLVAVPATRSVTAGGSLAVKGIAIADPWAATVGGTMALNVYDKTGTIAIAGHTYGPGGGKVAGGMLVGTEAQLNADLATLTYKAGAKAGSDTLSIDVWNQAGVEVTKTIAIGVTAPVPTTTATPAALPATPASTGGAGMSSVLTSAQQSGNLIDLRQMLTATQGSGESGSAGGAGTIPSVAPSGAVYDIGHLHHGGLPLLAPHAIS